ncbi:MAG TPA: CDP-alcohol phosphatidyltransferase family protein [Amycolatopsis sp.]|uniref:CDP-alcohol phosphatidyltransferase family protein n=1 Tax=Amycolatopsis sp. TaxID=37632 RepID=UPI002B4A40FE|nr:CDP-alcohol phosphatidyltransferase family protein [Amycolatopsis sp.]HKS49748.1 CDP-alcohol phosphatidyltransferase family protein [Amycolatopsis sp.]
MDNLRFAPEGYAILKTNTVSADHELAAAAGAQMLLVSLLNPGVVGWLTAVGYTVALATVLAFALRRWGTHVLRPADHVTLARAVLVGGVTVLVAERAPEGVVFVSIAAVALALDAVDGLVARRTGTASPLGARFDMEVDAFLIMVLSAYVSFSLGPWVLMIGAMRYVFVAAAWFAPWLRSPLPPSIARKTVAALQGIVLVVAGLDAVPRPAAAALTVLALGSLVWSFGRDVSWLWRNRFPAYLEALPVPVAGEVTG